jgi:putative transposase
MGARDQSYLWLDAKHLKVRDRGLVRSKALVVAYAVHETGRREVIGIDLGEVEIEAFWTSFLRGLRSHGLAGVRLCVSDHHDGLKAAIAKILGCPCQRCTVHFVRNMHGHCRRQERGLVSTALREVFDAPSLGEAKDRAGKIIQRFRAAAPKVAELLEKAEEDLLAFYRFPQAHWPKLRSTNPLERINREIVRRVTSSASSPTTPRRSASPGRFSSSRTTSGWSGGATSRPSRSP